MAHNSFDAYSYDANFALKVTPFLWLIIFWSIHHTLLLCLSSLAKSGYVFGMVKDYAASVPMLVSDIPGAIVLVARLNRSPDAGAKIRWLWRHGIKFLLVGLLLGTIAIIYRYAPKIIANPENPAFWIVAANLGFIAYLTLSDRAKAIFADFPSPIQETEDSKPASKL